MQRFFDIIFSLIALLFCLPFFLIIACILKFTGEGEIFFLQKRIGKNKKNFQLIKFATMNKNSPFEGTKTITLLNDDRILPFGKFLRKFKINELPQILNVLLGHMSIIGPRPLATDNFNFYSEQTKDIISKALPGLSGIGSIIFRNEEKFFKNEINTADIYKNIISPYKGELEKWYIQNQNIYLYFVLIFITIISFFNFKLKFLWKLFPSLPIPTKNINDKLNIL